MKKKHLVLVIFTVWAAVLVAVLWFGALPEPAYVTLCLQERAMLPGAVDTPAQIVSLWPPEQVHNVVVNGLECSYTAWAPGWLFMLTVATILLPALYTVRMRLSDVRCAACHNLLGMLTTVAAYPVVAYLAIYVVDATAGGIISGIVVTGKMLSDAAHVSGSRVIPRPFWPLLLFGTWLATLHNLPEDWAIDIALMATVVMAFVTGVAWIAASVVSDAAETPSQNQEV